MRVVVGIALLDLQPELVCMLFTCCNKGVAMDSWKITIVVVQQEAKASYVRLQCGGMYRNMDSGSVVSTYDTLSL